MRSSLVFAAFAFFGVCLGAASDAHAQYKNNSFGFDVGPWLITKPSVAAGPSSIKPADQRPLRLTNGVRIGGETNFKMNDDHFWFTARVNAGALQFPGGNPNGSLDEQYDAAAKEALGTLLGVEGGIGVRYLFLTDRFRPYLQASLSYMRLFSFTSAASAGCDAAICNDNSGSNEAEFLSHPNVGGVHLQPGAEIIFTRDVALHLYLDMQRWIIFNADDNNAVVGGLGIVFFT